MSSRPGMCIKLFENRAFMTLLGMSMVLLTVAGMVVGIGMSPIHMWLIMASVCIVWLAFCRCITWQRKTTERLRAEEVANRHFAIGTISNQIRGDTMAANGRTQHELNDHMLMMMMRDTPPSYDVINADLEQLPPSYSSAVLKLAPPDEHGLGELPPPYDSDLPLDSVASDSIHEDSGNNVNRDTSTRQLSVEPSTEYISVVSGKTTEDTPVQIQ